MTESEDLQKRLPQELKTRGNITRYSFASIIGRSAAMRSAVRKAEKLAPASGTVLMQGESGTGKEPTTDGGKNGALITSGIPATSFTRVIREDLVRPGLLFAGTETGMFVSPDAGASWQPLQLNLPVTPIHDCVIKDADLVVATHGRGFWILDDITPLREVPQVAPEASVHLFPPSPAYRVRMESTVYYKEAGAKQYVTVGAHVTPVPRRMANRTPWRADRTPRTGWPSTTCWARSQPPRSPFDSWTVTAR